MLLLLLLLSSRYSNDFDLLQCSIVFCSYGCRHGACMTDLRLGFLLDLYSTIDFAAGLKRSLV